MRIMLWVGMLAIAAYGNGARAQFVGDVFFEPPSVAVIEGEEATIEVQAFMGSIVLGGVHLSLEYVPSELEVVVLPGTTEQVQNHIVTKESVGSVGVVVLNAESLERPFGTVGIARVRVRPLGEAGSTSTLSITVQDVVDAASEPLASFQGFDGEVVVTAPTSAVSTSAAGITASAAALEERAAKLRRPGAAVDLAVLRGDKTATKVSVVLSDHTVASE